LPVSTRDENRFGTPNGLRDEWVFCRLPARQNQSGDRIDVAELLDIRVVIVVTAGPYYEKVATMGAFAKPPESRIEVLPASHERRSLLGLGLEVLRIADANVLIRRLLGVGGSLSLSSLRGCHKHGEPCCRNYQ